MYVAHGRNTLFQPVPFPLHQAGQGEALETRITACFGEGIYRRRDRENMLTALRKALLPTPPRVWVLKTGSPQLPPAAGIEPRTF